MSVACHPYAAVEFQDDPYAILGVHRGASPTEVRNARNRLLLHWHPDRTTDPQAVERAARINAAYKVLSDPRLRAAYDRGGPGVGVTSLMGQPPASTWAPATSDGERAAAQRRLVDRFRDARPARHRGRRWSDTVAPPAGWAEVRVRLLTRALPFAVLAAASLVALPHLRQALPAPVAAAAVYLPVYAWLAVLRALTGRVTSFAAEAWGRFTLSWVVGVAAILAFDHWVAGRAWDPVPATLARLVPVVLLLVAAVVVYRAARGFRPE